MQIELVRASAECALRQRLDVPPGTTVAEALAASRFADERPAALAVYGQLVAPERILEQGDRIELLCELLIDPMEARRRRAADGRVAARRVAAKRG